MINAHIEMDLNNHISVVASRITEIIGKDEPMILESLMRKFLKQHIQYTPDQFMDALTFLFSMNCLLVRDYRVVLRNV
jgi:hypothetical protein